MVLEEQSLSGFLSDSCSGFPTDGTVRPRHYSSGPYFLPPGKRSSGLFTRSGPPGFKHSKSHS